MGQEPQESGTQSHGAESQCAEEKSSPLHLLNLSERVLEIIRAQPLNQLKKYERKS